MEKKLLIYNMPESKLDFLEEAKEEFEYEIIRAFDEDLTRLVEDILNDSPKLGKDVERQPLDINFMMMHNFDQEDLNSFLRLMKEKEVSIPNKCVSTSNNMTWILQDLLKENKEEHEMMEVYSHLMRARAFGLKLLEDGLEDESLIGLLEEVDQYIKTRKFKTETLKNHYNKLAQKLNQHI